MVLRILASTAPRSTFPEFAWDRDAGPVATPGRHCSKCVPGKQRHGLNAQPCMRIGIADQVLFEESSNRKMLGTVQRGVRVAG